MILENGIELRPIPISPNSDYMAGSDGNIYSRTKYKGFGRKEYVEWYPLRGHVTKRRYRTVSLSHNSIKTTKTIHRLVCMAFHGMPTPKTLQTRHLDGDPNNNRPENLRWGTQVENWQDRKIHGRGMEGEKHHASKLSNIEREHIRWVVRKGLCSQRQIAIVLGMSQAAISSICRSKVDFKEVVVK